ncbi:MAG: YlbF family regulator [Firmicutes bacterium]|uniref:YlbF family regulator n=1 Tax=Candidatus Gallilactobacillus intestinavium TaxID=2840838 RepID=A0A9D9E641_9LACO|nr:YlbF family regulator [Candidatus Gallilactobacillus intestinavium]
MSQDIEETAKKMADDFKKTDEFVALEKAYKNMKSNNEAFEEFKKFQKLQFSLRKKDLSQEELTEEEVKKAQDQAAKIGSFDEIKDLMKKEKAVNDLLSDLNKILTDPIRDLYDESK